MGIAIPQVVTEDRAGGAQSIEGSLRFDSSKSHYLGRTPNYVGNRKNWTWSGWVKKTRNGVLDPIFYALYTDSVNYGHLYFSSGDLLQFDNNGYYCTTAAVYRDNSAWYHIVLQVDTTQAIAANRTKIYVNGVRVALTFPAGDVPLDYEGFINIAHPHRLGASQGNYSSHHLSNIYLIDGQVLGPEYFGYTDSLTNTWRPKKYIGNFNIYPNIDLSATGSGESLDIVINRQVDKCWIKSGGVWQGGGNPSDPSSEPSFYLLNGETAANLYFFTTGYTTEHTIVIGPSSETGNQPQWVTSTGSFSYTATTVSGTLNDSYASARTGALLDNTVYAFTFTITTPSIYANHSGFFISDSTSYSSGVPDEQGGNTIGARFQNSQNGYNAGVKVNGLSYTINYSGSNGYLTNRGINSFYLPLDGNTPIGKDMSGRGNDWTAVNFGGSNTIEKATGALPILNTDGGGKVARVGVRTDAVVTAGLGTCVLALPLVGLKSDFSAKIDSRSTEKVITATNAIASISQSNFYGGSFYFDGTGDYLTTNSSTELALGSGNYTIECWQYLASTTGYRYLFDFRTGSSIYAYYDTGTSTLYCASTSALSSVDVPLNTWVHIALVRNNSTVTLYVNGVARSTVSDSTNYSTSTVYSIGARNDNTLTFNGFIQDFRVYKGVAKYTSNFIPASTDPDILPDTPSGVVYSSNVALVPSTDGAVALNGTGDYLKTVGASSDFAMGTGNFTVEMFIYPQTVAVYSPGILSWSSTEGTTTDYTNAGFIAYGSDGIITVLLGTNSSYASISTPASGPLLKFNLWNHIAIVRDTGNTFRVFVNGELAVTDTTTLASTNITAQYMNFGAYYTGTNYMVRGFISNVHVVKGTALYSSNFTPPVVGIASTTNTKLLFAKSGISTTATEVTPSGVTIGIAGTARVTNFNPFTANINTQRGKPSGYATLNPIANGGTLSKGNLKFTSGAAYRSSVSTIGMSSGKWYMEGLAGTFGNDFLLGIVSYTDIISVTSTYVGGTSASYGYEAALGAKYNNTSYTTTNFSTYYTNDLISVAFDADNGKVYFAKNGIWQDNANPVAGTNASYSSLTSTPYFFGCSAGAGGVWDDINFGQKPFKFPPPPGFQPLALANTPRPTIVRPDQYVGVSTFSGTATSSVGAGVTQTISGFKFSPDLIWVKARTVTATIGGYANEGYHVVVDTVRGRDKILSTNYNGAELTNASTIPSFNRNGFDVGYEPSWDLNMSGDHYVAWTWKAGGSGGGQSFWKDDIGYSTASAAGLTAGTITPTGASVNTKSGFSIITYTGTGSALSFSHGLAVAPSLVIIKQRNADNYWAVGHSYDWTKILYLNTTDSAGNGATAWSSAPTSSVINLGSSGYVNVNNGTFVAYCWAEIPGFSKFGSYSGNSSSDGPVIVTGFRPRWVMVKCSSSSSTEWRIHDTARNEYNAVNLALNAEGSYAEYSTGLTFDIVSNGFKPRASGSHTNNSGQTYIYAAFAETPSFNLYGGQANAR